MEGRPSPSECSCFSFTNIVRLGARNATKKRIAVSKTEVELPYFVLHDVLSMLPREDAARTSVLSKRWNRVWETFPDLIFDQCRYANLPLAVTEIYPRYDQQVGNFLDAVKRYLLRATRRGLRGHKFTLTTAIVGPELTSKLNECFELALRSCAAEIDIDHFETYLRGRGPIDLPEIALVSNPFGYCSLRVLSLQRICLSEKSTNDIFLSCPNIGSLSLFCIRGIKKLDIPRLDRLEVVKIFRVKQLSVVILNAPKLQSFWLVFEEVATCALNLTSCRILRVLDLFGITITDELFLSLITACPFLEELTIINCKMQRHVIISSKYLTRLVLGCDEIESVEIDAPALVSFKHHAAILPRLFLKTIPSQVEIAHSLDLRIPILTSHFVNLRKFLSIYTLIDCFKVIVSPSGNPNVVFEQEELRQVVVPRTFQLQHLKLELRYVEPSFDEIALIDGLLWSFHPKKISVFLWSTKKPHCCIKVLSESLLEMEKNSTCCGSARVKCWRHDLKSARAQIFEESGHDKPVVCFELEWCDSIW